MLRIVQVVRPAARRCACRRCGTVRSCGGVVGLDQLSTKTLALLAKLAVVHAVGLGQALDRAARQRHAVDLRVQRRILAGGEVDEAGGLVDREHAVDRPVARGQRASLAAVGRQQVQVLEAAALADPQDAAVLEEAQVVVQRHPGLAGLGEQRALLAAAPGRPRSVRACAGRATGAGRSGAAGRASRRAPGRCPCSLPRSTHCGSASPLRRDHAQLHQHVVVAGGGIALLDHFGAVGIDLVALLHRHRRFVDAREGDAPNRPAPTSSRCGGPFPRRRRTRRRRCRWSSLPSRVSCTCLPLARSITHRLRSRTKLTKPPFGEIFGSVAKPSPLVSLRTAALPGLRQVVQVQLAAEREQQRLAVRRPLVVDDAAERGDALALAARLLFVAEHFRRPAGCVGVDQHARSGRWRCRSPTGRGGSCCLLAAQEGHAAAVGRDLRPSSGSGPTAARRRPALRA